jgi:hypothetical protein
VRLIWAKAVAAPVYMVVAPSLRVYEVAPGEAVQETVIVVAGPQAPGVAVRLVQTAGAQTCGAVVSAGVVPPAAEVPPAFEALTV